VRIARLIEEQIVREMVPFVQQRQVVAVAGPDQFRPPADDLPASMQFGRAASSGRMFPVAMRSGMPDHRWAVVLFARLSILTL
jgi:hypothetical protein